MKKILAILGAVLLVVGLAACGGEESYEGKRVVYDPPSGYELYAQGDVSAAYVIEDAEGNYTHSIRIVVQDLDDQTRQALKATKQENFEEYMDTDFDENITVSFVKMNGYRGVKLETHDDDGTLTEVFYMLSVGDWSFSIHNQSDSDTLSEVDASMQEVIDSIRIEKFVFGA